jgi:hypothetical protein
LQEKIAANGNAQISSQLSRTEKTRAELAAEARVSERTIENAAKRAASASQRAALILERNRLGYTHGGDRRSWKFADKEWRHGQDIGRIAGLSGAAVRQRVAVPGGRTAIGAAEHTP